MRELHLVWVSHMHADHHGGLYRLLQLRAQLVGWDNIGLSGTRAISVNKTSLDEGQNAPGSQPVHC